MTGRITSIGPDTGTIQAETRRKVSFDLSAVLTYDLAALAVGQAVTFDLRAGAHVTAINIVVQNQAKAPSVAVHDKPRYLRYMGFEQNGHIRVYRFDLVIPGEETKQYTVTADVSLFTSHSVGLQEGPALCLQTVTRELDAADGIEPSGPMRPLTDQDMLAHLARLPASRKPSRQPHGLSAPRSG